MQKDYQKPIFITLVVIAVSLVMLVGMIGYREYERYSEKQMEKQIGKSPMGQLLLKSGLITRELLREKAKEREAKTIDLPKREPRKTPRSMKDMRKEFEKQRQRTKKIFGGQ